MTEAPFDTEAYWDSDSRERGSEPEPEWLIPDLLYPGAVLLVAAPNAGKSFLADQLAHHLAYGRPLGDWDAPALGGHYVWKIDLETDESLNRDRGYAITPYGELPEDGAGVGNRRDRYIRVQHHVIPPALQTEWYGVFATRADAHIRYLDEQLAALREADRLPSLVIIDTKEKFLSGKPQQENAYSWDADKIGELNRVALKYGACILMLHHTNKAGETSGSTGNTGSVEIEMHLDKITDEDTGVVTGLLRSTKVRRGPQFRYPLVQSPLDGVWSFDGDTSIAVAVSLGHKRSITEALARQGMNYRELNAATGIEAGTLRKVCQRLARVRMIVKRYGRWWLAPDAGPRRPGGGAPAAPTPEGERLAKVGTCAVCGGLMPITEDGQDTHPACSPAPSTGEHVDSASPAGDDTAGPAETVDPEELNGFRALAASIERSRMKPVTRIRAEERESAPWSLVTERMTGEHRWMTPLEIAPDSPVLILDRNGSYPAAMSSAPIVANVPTHTGPLRALPPQTAGMFLIGGVSWTDTGIGHPLGKIADRPGPWWVTTPHLILLGRLHGAGRIPAPEILDSWTGRRTDGLFTAFSREVQEARLAALDAGDDDAYTAVKRASSVAIRCLWPKGARSPFWRPDWSVSVRAEAAVRHWIRADQALSAGAVLLKLGSVDEVAMVRPESGEVPRPYVIGRRYGQVKIKAQGMTYGEWVSPRANGHR